MRVLGWQIQFRKRRCETVGSFPGALNRVRLLRERCQWPPLSIEPAIRQREERISEARQRVIYKPAPYDELGAEPTRKAGRYLFGLGGPLPWPLVIAFVVGCGVVLAPLVTIWPDWRARSSDPVVGRTTFHPLPVTPSFLTEDLALQTARVAIAAAGLSLREWMPAPANPDSLTSAPDGRVDVYLRRNPKDVNNSGIIDFTSDQSSGSCVVLVTLQGQNVTCSVQIAK